MPQPEKKKKSEYPVLCIPTYLLWYEYGLLDKFGRIFEVLFIIKHQSKIQEEPCPHFHQVFLTNYTA